MPVIQNHRLKRPIVAKTKTFMNKHLDDAKGVYLASGLLSFFAAAVSLLFAFFSDNNIVFYAFGVGAGCVGVITLLIRRYMEKPFGRAIAIAFSICNLLQFPIGTILHGIALKDLLKRQSKGTK